MQIYSTLTRRKEEFVPVSPGKVGLYVCGINPYDYSHVGHARCYVVFDVIRRHLEFSGYSVTHVQNFTDIEDNIIARSRERGIGWREMVEQFIAAYFQDMDALGVLRAHHYPRATEHIPEMLELIRCLFDRGLAYQADGDVFLEVGKLPDYGKLSGRRPEEMQAGARVEVDPRKRDPLDFALWKAAKPDEPSWPSPWGPGRPGWHIECSAMSAKYLGTQFDIHGGGTDLIFPHHENELAQSEGCTGHHLARYWVHNGWVTVNREKMSKSLGNFFTIREVLEQFSPEALRLFLLGTHYRSPVDFSDQALRESTAALERIQIGLAHLDRLLAQPDREQAAELDDLMAAVDAAERDFREAMDDDFNTPRALAALFTLVAEVHRATGPEFRVGPRSRPALARARETLLQLAGVLGLTLAVKLVDDIQLRAKIINREEQLIQLLGEVGGESPVIPKGVPLEERLEQLVNRAINTREQARKAKQYDVSDRIRSRLAELGFLLEDHTEGTSWRVRK